MLKVLTDKWKFYLGDKKFRINFIISVALLVIVLFLFTRFLLFVQNREGVHLPDPLLNLFEPVDLTWFIFFLIYSALLMAILTFISSPVKLLTGIQLYAAMVIIRMVAMYLTPLEPPLKMIPLEDPLVEYFGTGELLTKDLFFSGHTATLFLLFLISENKKIRYALLLCTVLTALFVILQHVHFTIDVFAAVFFTYGCYNIIVKINKHFNLVILNEN